jgi:hypothetical protein
MLRAKGNYMILPKRLCIPFMLANYGNRYCTHNPERIEYQ